MNKNMEELDSLLTIVPSEDLLLIRDASADTTNKIIVNDILGAVNVSAWGGLEAAVTAIGATKMGVCITNTQTLTGDLTIPSTLALVIEQGGSIDLNGYTLTINGSFSAGLYQVFSGDGRIVFESGSTDKIPVIWRGVVGDGTDTTTEMQSLLLDMKSSTVKRCEFGFGEYLFTDTLNVYAGMILEGQNKFSVSDFQDGMRTAEIPTQITFAPTAEKSLFHIINDTADSYSSKVHISGLYLKGNTTEGVTYSKYGLHLEESARSIFENMGIEHFQVGLHCDFTMTNAYENIYIGACSSSCVDISTDINTTDTFTNCIFRESPWGVVVRRSITIRFVSCLFESLSVGGVRLYREAGADFITCYSENVPSGADGADYGMFYIGHDGTTTQHSINIIGGFYGGCNGGTVYGSFVDADYLNYYSGICISNVNIQRFVNGIKANQNNTDAHSILVNNLSFASVTNVTVNPDKTTGTRYPIIVGFYPTTVSTPPQLHVRSIYSTFLTLNDDNGYGSTRLRGMSEANLERLSDLVLTNFSSSTACLLLVTGSDNSALHEAGLFSVATDADGNTSVVKVAGTANITITNTDNNLCVYPSTTTVRVRNLLTSTIKCKILRIQ